MNACLIQACNMRLAFRSFESEVFGLFYGFGIWYLLVIPSCAELLPYRTIKR